MSYIEKMIKIVPELSIEDAALLMDVIEEAQDIAYQEGYESGYESGVEE